MKEQHFPKYLYKVLSVRNWEKSQGQEFVKLSDKDEEFIHLATEDQLDRIIAKYWNQVPEFIILTIETLKLPGQLAFEANPSGTNKYYHLYSGSIPLEAVIESKKIQVEKDR